MGEKVLENIARKEGVYKVNRFTKTNGVSDETERAYQLEFDADSRVSKSKYTSSSGVFNLYVSSYRARYLACHVWRGGRAKQKLSDTLFFQKTEKGWRGGDGKVY